MSDTIGAEADFILKQIWFHWLILLHSQALTYMCPSSLSSIHTPRCMSTHGIAMTSYSDMEDKRYQFSLSLLGSSQCDHWDECWFLDVSLAPLVAGSDCDLLSPYLSVLEASVLFFTFTSSCFVMASSNGSLFFVSGHVLFSWFCCPENLCVEVLWFCWPGNLGCIISCLVISLLS